MSKRRAQSGSTPAVIQLTEAGVSFRQHEYAHSPDAESFGMEAAQELGVAAEQVFKTLLVEVDGKLGVTILPVDRRLDLKAAAAALSGKKASLADPQLAQRSTGYVLGGISPFGQRRRLPTVLDESARAHETIFVSGGKRGLDLEVAPVDLVRVLNAATANLTR
ncbi:Cys-tRNA(Pro) deacylase [Gephyromycinifex aptenodytis]|uniref:Cys-tRNA(Pro) deacylase n=1 Tax=Gephyromycinifex aptenodytis TaxID=2716227 RepID=UPI001446B31A|nr:Cys-tRNA(Pro) deacylase [Gephyromycinifex aptenodytis]